MQICRKLGGYSYGRADLVRRAMAKKKKDVMEQERSAFIYGTKTNCGAVANGVPEKTANEIFDDMAAFATYAFNKSHAAAYAFLAYQTAYLRCHYYKEYMVGLMTSVPDNAAKLLEYISDLKSHGVAVLPPDINKSMLNFSAEEGGVRFGLLAIRNLGRNFINEIIDARSERPFADITDFLSRLSGREINRRAVESLIKAGAFDALPHNRRELLCSYENLYQMTAESHNRNLSGQMGFFDYGADDGADNTFIAKLDNFTPAQLMKLEKEALGFYATGHPLECYEQYMRLNGISKIADITGLPEGRKVSILATLSAKKSHTTKNNKLMCFASFEDMSGEIEGVIFDEVYAVSLSLLNRPDIPLIVSGTVSVTASDSGDEPPKLIVNRIESADDIKPTDYHTLYINLESENSPLIPRIAEVLRGCSGREEVRLCFRDTRRVSRINDISGVNITKEIVQKLVKICGKSNIILK